MGRLLRLRLTALERSRVVGHQSLAHGRLARCDLATDRQQGMHDIVRKRDALTVSRVNRRNSASRCARSPSSPWVIGHGCTTQLPPSVTV